MQGLPQKPKKWNHFPITHTLPKAQMYWWILQHRNKNMYLRLSAVNGINIIFGIWLHFPKTDHCYISARSNFHVRGNTALIVTNLINAKIKTKKKTNCVLFLLLGLVGYCWLPQTHFTTPALSCKNAVFAIVWKRFFVTLIAEIFDTSTHNILETNHRALLLFDFALIVFSPKEYSEASQTTKMELFAKLFND